MLVRSVMLLFTALLAANPLPGPRTDFRPTHVDSISLARSRCFGYCPAYRVTITADGTVRFTAGDTSILQPGDVSAIPPDAFRQLAKEAALVSFRSLPDVIARDPALCAARATDHPTATVTVFRSDTTFRVVDYQGCYARHQSGNPQISPEIARLRQFETRIDSVAGTERWLAHARSRASADRSSSIRVAIAAVELPDSSLGTLARRIRDTLAVRLAADTTVSPYMVESLQRLRDLLSGRAQPVQYFFYADIRAAGADTVVVRWRGVSVETSAIVATDSIRASRNAPDSLVAAFARTVRFARLRQIRGTRSGN